MDPDGSKDTDTSKRAKVGLDVEKMVKMTCLYVKIYIQIMYNLRNTLSWTKIDESNHIYVVRATMKIAPSRLLKLSGCKVIGKIKLFWLL